MSGPDGVMLRQNALAVILVTVPLLIITAMSIRTVVLDRAAAQSLATQAVRDVLDVHAAQLAGAIGRFSAKKLKDVNTKLSKSQDPLLFLRGIVHESSPAFASLFEDGRRIFPPEDAAAQLWQERRALSHLGTTLALARERSKTKSAGTAWGRLGEAAALVTCDDVGAGRTLCVVATQDELQATLDAILEKIRRSLPQPAVLIDPWGHQQWPLQTTATTEPSTTLDLAEPLESWKIRASVSATSGSAALLVAAMVVSITAGWGVALVLLLRQQVDAARQHRARAESTARLSHDLRTPIANLAIYVDLIDRHGHDNAAITRCCKALKEEVARLAIIAERTLQRSRGEAPPAEQGALVSVDWIVTNLTARYAPLMASAGCSISFDAGAPAAMVDDQTTLERIVINLLDNARLHASGAKVKVATQQASDGILLTICDDGVRENSQTHESSASNGLGLKVVEELARSRGGTFLASIDKAGSRFEISLPSKCAMTP